MNIKKIISNMSVRPTNNKVKKTKKFLRETNILPKELPIEKSVYIVSAADKFESVKNKIAIDIEKIKMKKEY